MKRYFVFTWKYTKNKYNPIERHNLITITNATGDIGQDCKFAADQFAANFGNFKKAEIISIQEIDENNNPIGEIITPMEGVKVVPSGR